MGLFPSQVVLISRQNWSARPSSSGAMAIKNEKKTLNFTTWSYSCPTCTYEYFHKFSSISDPVKIYASQYKRKLWVDTAVDESLSSLLQLNIVNGHWSDWMQTSSCSVTCGNGTLSYLRPCTNPRPSWGGQECPGIGQRTEECYAGECPPPGK